MTTQPSVNTDIFGASMILFVSASPPPALLALLQEHIGSLKCAASDERARAHIIATPPTLLLVDAALPNDAAYMLCAELRARPATSKLPVLFLLASDQTPERCFAVGGNDYIQRPLRATDALARIEHQLTIQQLRAQLAVSQREAHAAQQAKETFLANISHELRTPLHAVLGFTELLLHDSRLNEQLVDQLSIVYRNGQQLMQLVNDLLSLARLEARSHVVDSAPCNVHHLLSSVATLYRLRASSRGLYLRLEQSTSIPPVIMTDEPKLRQVLASLLANAVKFTHEGGIVLRADYMDTTLYLEVSDTGVGISANERDRLFEPFAQAPPSSAQPREGAGLGLSISQHLVRLLGGVLHVESTPGRGSRFWFTLEVSAADPHEQPAPSAPQQVIGIAPDQMPARILVVDDDHDSRLLLRHILAVFGFAVHEAANGQQAIALWDEHLFDLILIDMRMPVMDGHETTRYIRRTTRGQAVAIVALTSQLYQERRTVLLSAGCDDVLPRPFSLEAVCEVLTRQLGTQFVYAQSDTDALALGNAHRGF